MAMVARWPALAVLALSGCIEPLQDETALDQRIAAKQNAANQRVVSDAATSDVTPGDALAQDTPVLPDSLAQPDKATPADTPAPADNSAQPDNPLLPEIAADVPAEVAPPQPVCGNGEIEPPEQCDDSNQSGNDGCSALCQFEVAPPAGMVFVPTGKFVMGCDSTIDKLCDTGMEKPQSTVQLSAFFIDKTEVTRKAYQECQSATKCTALMALSGCNANNDPQSPVMCLGWDQAKTLCTFAGKRLCTEPEWEYAARGTDGRMWPNGPKPPTCAQSNEKNCDGKPRLVGMSGACVSPFGTCDQAGNVAEWTADDFAAYTAEAKTNPPPVNSPSDAKIVRGGHYDSPYDETRASARLDVLPNAAGPVIGVRCCKSLK